MPKPSSSLEFYEKLVATNPKVERKGATVPYTSLNGHMFSYLSKEGKLALRLPPPEREEFLKKYPNDPLVPDVKKQIASLKKQIAQARSGSGAPTQTG